MFERKGLKGNYGPQLSLNSSVFVWNEETTFGPTVIRDYVTTETSVTLAQPLTPLWAVYQGVKAATYAEESAELDIDAAKRTQVKDAVQAYYRVLQASGAVKNAERAVELLEAQSQRVKALVEVGAAPPAESLRLEVALAAARQEVLRAQSNLDVVRGALALAAGSRAGETLDAAPISNLATPPEVASLDQAVESGLANRHELKQLELTKKQAAIGTLAQKADYIPEVVALARYTHSTGSGLSAAESAFVGAQLSWTIFQWGTRARAVDAAQAQEIQVAAGEELARRQIALQIQSAWQDLRASRGSHTVALAAIVQAEEAYRIEEARYTEGEATTTELLDAQSALLEAQNNQNAALYQAWINYAELVFATGASLAEFGENR